MKQSDLFWALNDMDEGFILEAQEPSIQENKSRSHPLRIGLIIAAAMILLASTAYAAIQYTKSTQQLERSWNETAKTVMTQEQKDYVETRSADFGESITNNGITVILDSVTCTESKVDLLFSIKADPERYPDSGNNWTVSPIFRAENPDWGSYAPGSENSSLHEAETGVWNLVSCTFAQLPDGASLCDGKTSLYVEITEVSPGNVEDDMPINGAWTFVITLPESAASSVKSTEIQNTLSGISLEIHNITVTDAAITFDVDGSGTDYNLTTAMDFVSFMREAEPETTFLTVEVLLTDGTAAAMGSSSMYLDQNTGLDHWTFNWAAPLDPKQVTYLRISDGTKIIEIPIS